LVTQLITSIQNLLQQLSIYLSLTQRKEIYRLKRDNSKLMSTTAFITLEGNKNPYVRFGSGPKLLVALPGYGDRKEVFLNFATALSATYTVYAIDLPGHGESEWAQDAFFKSDLEKLIQAILQKENKTQFTLMGHSFGSRAILSMLPTFADVLDEIILLAPDGLDEGYMRRATLLPKGIRKLLQRFLKNPNWYIGLVTAFNKIGLLKDYSLHFVKLNFANPKRRKRLFLFWNSMDEFIIKPKAVSQLLNDKKVSVQIILGKRDFVIPGAAWKEWAKNLDSVSLVELEADHRIVGGELNVYFLSWYGA